MAAVVVDILFNGLHDRNGDLMPGGLVYTYGAGSNVSAETWMDSEKTVLASNPIVLDSEGKATIYADGRYKFVIKTAAEVSVKTVDDLTYLDPKESSEPLTIISDTLPQITAGYDVAHTMTVEVDSNGNVDFDCDGTNFEFKKQVRYSEDFTTPPVEFSDATDFTLDSTNFTITGGATRVGGVVFLHGRATVINSDTTPMTILDPLYLPSANRSMPASANDGGSYVAAVVQILTTGAMAVSLVSGSALATGDIVFFDGVSYTI